MNVRLNNSMRRTRRRSEIDLDECFLSESPGACTGISSSQSHLNRLWVLVRKQDCNLISINQFPSAPYLTILSLDISLRYIIKNRFSSPTAPSTSSLYSHSILCFLFNKCTSIHYLPMAAVVISCTESTRKTKALSFKYVPYISHSNTKESPGNVVVDTTSPLLVLFFIHLRVVPDLESELIRHMYEEEILLCLSAFNSHSVLHNVTSVVTVLRPIFFYYNDSSGHMTWQPEISIVYTRSYQIYRKSTSFGSFSNRVEGERENSWSWQHKQKGRGPRTKLTGRVESWD